jgi:lysozyme family protein
LTDYGENFRRSLAKTLGSEGGYSNDAADKGGPTMMGVTASTLARAHNMGIVGHNDVHKLTRDEVAEIYAVMYWQPCHADDMPWPLCAIHFDMAVNCGIGGAGRTMQRALNRLYQCGLVVDGDLGPASLLALKRVLAHTNALKTICEEYCNQREAYYRRIVANNPAQAKFLRGWLNRVARNRQLIEG